MQCESEAQDLDATVVANQPQGNHPPVVTAVSPQQAFALPTCAVPAGTHEYLCVADGAGLQFTPVTVSVTASDVDGDPLRYTWEFVPDPAQGQSDGEVLISNPLAPAPQVMVRTTNRPPQGRYLLRVTVRDNKGGAAVAETTVEVPGDAPPNAAVSGPAAVNEICETQPNATDGWRCYADLTVQGTPTDPDGPDQTSIILVVWEDVTDRETSGYRAVTTFADGYTYNPGLQVYASENHATTPAGYPLRLRMTAVDVRGQQASAEVSVIVCPATGCVP
jgi:hypothetical protein